MSDPYPGGCACGAVRYRIPNEPLVMNDCQCRDCQQRCGTGHGSYLTFANKAGVLLEGQAQFWEVAGDSGNIKTHAFCPRCGAPVYLTFAAAPHLFTIHAGSLDDPSRYVPGLVIYSSRGLSWDRTDPALPSFEKMPPR